MQEQRLDVFQVIADPSRREILLMLSKESRTINALADNFEMSRPAVSKHIKVLYNAGFIAIDDVGRERHCTLKQDGFKQLNDWLAYYDNFWSQKLNKLAILLNNKTNEK
jgi:DNA-binding transcriptional ArsR family regulator